MNDCETLPAMYLSWSSKIAVVHSIQTVENGMKLHNS